MPGVDIRPLKQRLRMEIKAWRRAIPQERKAVYDQKILRRLFATREYQRCKTLLTYVSLPIEPNTHLLIEQALADGKRVAVPRCVPNTKQMEFYYISGLEDLSPQTFGVLEPSPESCRRFSEVKNSICIVPALAYDLAGYRLGYGSGYYDRFLSKYPCPKIGLGYTENMRKALWHGRFDVPVDLVVTEQRLYSCVNQRRKRLYAVSKRSL